MRAWAEAHVGVADVEAPKARRHRRPAASWARCRSTKRWRRSRRL